jgi:hypothetical protein
VHTKLYGRSYYLSRFSFGHAKTNNAGSSITKNCAGSQNKGKTNVELSSIYLGIGLIIGNPNTKERDLSADRPAFRADFGTPAEPRLATLSQLATAHHLRGGRNLYLQYIFGYGNSLGLDHPDPVSSLDAPNHWGNDEISLT